MNDALRAVVIAGVVLAILLGAAREQPVREGVQRIDDVVTFTDAALLVRTALEPPDVHALDALAGMSTVAPLLAARPLAPRLTAQLPQQLIAGRTAGLHFFVSGPPGAREHIYLTDARGIAMDSAAVVMGASAVVRGAFRVRPAGAGWHEWSVAAGGETRAVAAWVLPERPPRVLIAAGPPSPEARFVARALEETGADVELRQPLGHGLTAGTPGGMSAGVPVDASELAPFDVVIVLPGALLDAPRRTALEQFVAALGGGLLIAARDPLLQTLGIAAGEQPNAGTVNAADVVWTLPPELASLPAGSESSPITTQIEPLIPSAEAFTAATGGDGTALLALRSVGRGRTAALGLRESWRWRVAGGHSDEHREFWRALIDWLSPPPAAPRVDTPRTVAPPGLPVLLDVESATPLRLLRLRRPDGTTEPLPPLHGSPQRSTFAFVPADTGVYTMVLDESADEDAFGGVRVIADGSMTSAESAALLALIASASGGAALPADEVDDAVHAFEATRLASSTWQVPGSWRLFLLLLLLGLAVADWAVRRLRGAR